MSWKAFSNQRCANKIELALEKKVVLIASHFLFLPRTEVSVTGRVNAIKSF